MKAEDQERLKALARDFKDETDEELKRKREVYLSFIVSQTTEKIAKSAENLEFNQQAYRALSSIAQKRERARKLWDRVDASGKAIAFVLTFTLGLMGSPALEKYFAMHGTATLACEVAHTTTVPGANNP